MSKHLAKHAATDKKSAPTSPAPERRPVHAAPETGAAPERRTVTVESYESARTGRTGKKKGRRIFLTIFLILAFLIILAELAYLAFGYFYGKMNLTGALTPEDRAAAIASYADGPAVREEEEDLPEDAVMATDEEVESIQARIRAQLAAAGGSLMSDKDVVNLLLIGTDARTLDEKARSDVMMLISLNKKTNKIVLTSFMRDIYTYIPDYGYNRLNAPYAIAGADYLIETLEADFGVNIDNYAAVNFYAFADVIDAVDGIDLELTHAEVDFINGQAYDGEQAALGVGTGAVYLDYTGDNRYHLNGTQALAHCRNRSSAGSDFDRTSRQRVVISALIEKAKTLSLSELYSLANTVLPMISTDMSQGETLSLLLKSGDYLGYELESIRVPEDTEYSNAMINGMAVLDIDFAAASQRMKDAIYT